MTAAPAPGKWPGAACGTDVWHLRGSGRQGPPAPAVVVRRSCGNQELHHDRVRSRWRVLAVREQRGPHRARQKCWAPVLAPGPDVPPSTQSSLCQACVSLQRRESPGSGDDRSPIWRRVWARREGSHGRQGITCLIGHLASTAVKPWLPGATQGRGISHVHDHRPRSRRGLGRGACPRTGHGSLGFPGRPGAGSAPRPDNHVIVVFGCPVLAFARSWVIRAVTIMVDGCTVVGLPSIWGTRSRSLRRCRTQLAHQLPGPE
jgi:hypothetical protein